MQALQRVIATLTLIFIATAGVRAAGTMTRVDSYGDWTLLTDSQSPHLFCFVTSEPKTSDPKEASRQAPRAFVSAWPKDGIKGEVSFRMGFRIRKNSEGTATVSPSGFRLFGANDRAFVTDSTKELKLLEAMRKGSTMSVSISPERGANVTDTYSLNGVGIALQKLQEMCF